MAQLTDRYEGPSGWLQARKETQTRRSRDSVRGLTGDGCTSSDNKSLSKTSVSR